MRFLAAFVASGAETMVVYSMVRIKMATGYRRGGCLVAARCGGGRRRCGIVRQLLALLLLLHDLVGPTMRAQAIGIDFPEARFGIMHDHIVCDPHLAVSV
ncbi:hypothetical protein JQ582_20530 [Bradyrhizobium japonicum]|uniref:hypothetical protein n=1 Tax=Bradyrhizobium japonicum TaxID=375 RepID=UPI001BAD7F44|nr:hypothetical protein [Bradyrhizobium japonicum]MBR0746325.1 hypothetical protein [Bradyrhizobium japonicum]